MSAAAARAPSTVVGAVGARHGRHAGRAHRRARRHLVAHLLHHVRGRADEDEVVVDARLDEGGVLGEEAVAGMHRLAAGRDRGRDDRRDAQVALGRRRRADVHGLIGQPDVQRVAVGGRVDRDRLDAELVQRADHAHGDLAAVCHQHAREHQIPSGRPLRRLELEQQLPVLDRRAVPDVDRAGRSPRSRPSPRSSASSPRGCRASGPRRRCRPPPRTAARPGAGRGVERARPSGSRRARVRTAPAGSAGSSSSPGAAAGAAARAATAGSSGVRRTLTRIPPSSTVISSMPVSWTIFTTSRMRSSRFCSTPRAPAVSSPVARSRIDRSSRSASSPKSASSSSSSSLEARPFALSRSESRSTGSSAGALAAQAHGPLERRVDRPGRRPEAAADEIAQLVDDRAVAVRPEHVDERLRRDDVAHGRRERRRARLDADALDLVEHLVEPAAGVARAQLDVGRRDDRGRQLAPRGAHGDARQQRRRRRVAEVLVDEVGGLPQRVLVDARVVARVPPAPRRPPRPRCGARRARRDTRRWRSGRPRDGPPRARSRARSVRRSGSRGRPGDPRARAGRPRARRPSRAAAARRDRGGGCAPRRSRARACAASSSASRRWLP